MTQSITLPIENIFELAHIRDTDSGMSTDDWKTLAKETSRLFNEFYVHLPLKRAMLAIDPVQRINLLINRIPHYRSEVAFLSELLSIFTELHDLHTGLVLPNPWNEMVAFLPFMIELCYDTANHPHYLVTKVLEVGLRNDFVPGVEVTHWNGVPMHRKILELGRQTAGANPAAQSARALSMLTIRSLAYVLPPQEDWVVLDYIGANGTAEVCCPWQVTRTFPTPNAPQANTASVGEAFHIGIDSATMDVQRTKKLLFRPEAVQFERKVQAISGQTDEKVQEPLVGFDYQSSTAFPQSLSFRVVNTSNGVFGYLRIWNFSVSDVYGFVNEVARIVRILPQNGLIIDVRSNPGGNIMAGESILQLFSSNRIQPQSVWFRNTDSNRMIVQSNNMFDYWRKSMDISTNTGMIFSQGFPLTNIDDANSIGRIYPGKIVVIIDALCYSTCCFFAAGVQDNNVGVILGVDKNTGAGGANVWTYQLLQELCQNMPSPLDGLPNGVNINIAMRQSTRVGINLGLPLEGIGVQADYIHHITINDLIYNNIDLINHAAQFLT